MEIYFILLIGGLLISFITALIIKTINRHKMQGTNDKLYLAQQTLQVAQQENKQLIKEKEELFEYSRQVRYRKL